MPRKSTAKPKLIERLSMWEWDTLVAAWRYYEHGATITSASFPWDIVRRYWGEGNNYSDNVRLTIANQFAITDHGGKGENDWTEGIGMRCDKVPWTTFYRFCEAEAKGYKQLTVKPPKGKSETLSNCFHCDYTDRWHERDGYIREGQNMFVDPQCIVSVEG